MLFCSGMALMLLGIFIGLWIVVRTGGPVTASPAAINCVASLRGGLQLLVAMYLDIQESAPRP